MRVLTFLARRFVAGDSADDAVKAVKRLNALKLSGTLDFLGEEVLDRAQAEAATREIEGLFPKISKAGLDCNVSLKLTQLGFAADEGLARANVERIADAAAAHGNFLRIDMEGSAYTQKTLDLFYKLYPARKNIGVVIQAYLRRSADDVAELNRLGARVRLCKGAYKEPASVAFKDMREVNDNYDRLAEALLAKGNFPAIATHDEDRIRAAQAAAKRLGVSSDKFEFQMLYGLRKRRWTGLVAEGFRMRVYVPYGTHWMPYYYRRLRERKENVMFLLKSLIKD